MFLVFPPSEEVCKTFKYKKARNMQLLLWNVYTLTYVTLLPLK